MPPKYTAMLDRFSVAILLSQNEIVPNVDALPIIPLKTFLKRRPGHGSALRKQSANEP